MKLPMQQHFKIACFCFSRK